MHISFHHRDHEKAPELPKRLLSGQMKGRLHFLKKGTYKIGEDKYAVAAEKILLTENQSKPPKLSWLEKKFFIIQKGEKTSEGQIYYKINKASLKARLGITEKDLKNKDFPTLISERLESKIAKEAFDKFSEFNGLDEDNIIQKLKSLPDHVKEELIEILQPQPEIFSKEELCKLASAKALKIKDLKLDELLQNLHSLPDYFRQELPYYLVIGIAIQNKDFKKLEELMLSLKKEEPQAPLYLDLIRACNDVAKDYTTFKLEWNTLRKKLE